MKLKQFSLPEWHLLSVVILFIFLYQPGLLRAEIKNGYEIELEETRQSLENINTMIKMEGRNNRERMIKLKKYLIKLKKIEARQSIYSDKTRKLLLQLKEIDPTLFSEIDSIKDKKGNSTDVYVKVVPLNKGQEIHGSTNLDQYNFDEDMYSSNYGIKIASVIVADCFRSIFLLAHELGHVKYQVPNLAEYFNFYFKTYRNSVQSKKGHARADQSGMSADETVKSFTQLYVSYRQSKNSKAATISSVKQKPDEY